MSHFWSQYCIFTSSAMVPFTCGEGWGYMHDSRADKDPYPHGSRADKDSYTHDRMWLTICVA